MEQQIFSLYDKKAKAYGAPFFQGNVDIAVRSFNDLYQDKSTSCNRHPEDYALYHFGSFNSDDGTFTILDKPVLLKEASEFVDLELITQ